MGSVVRRCGEAQEEESLEKVGKESFLRLLRVLIHHISDYGEVDDTILFGFGDVNVVLFESVGEAECQHGVGHLLSLLKGQYSHQLRPKDIRKISLKSFDHTFLVDLRGRFQSLKLFIGCNKFLKAFMEGLLVILIH